MLFSPLVYQLWLVLDILMVLILLGISGGGGSGCTGTFTISGGTLTSISITTAGTGYTSAPTLSFPGAVRLIGQNFIVCVRRCACTRFNIH
jgi:hypothetical protein